MQTYTFKCPDDLAEQLLSESEHRKMGKSDLIRRALVYYLARKGKALKRSSIYALSQDLCGSIEGPEDLSDNPDYLEGYGE